MKTGGGGGGEKEEGGGGGILVVGTQHRNDVSPDRKTNRGVGVVVVAVV